MALIMTDICNTSRRKKSIANSKALQVTKGTNWSLDMHMKDD